MEGGVTWTFIWIKIKPRTQNFFISRMDKTDLAVLKKKNVKEWKTLKKGAHWSLLRLKPFYGSSTFHDVLHWATVILLLYEISTFVRIAVGMTDSHPTFKWFQERYGDLVLWWRPETLTFTEYHEHFRFSWSSFRAFGLI